jgi:HK97 family phage portal protein
VGLIDRIFKRQTVNTTHPRDPVLADWFGGGGAGPSVTAQTAIGVPAVQACVNVLSESIAAMPLTVWRRTAGDQGEVRKEALDHPLHALLTGRICPHMTGVEWLEWQVQNTALRGDAFSRVISNNRGEITALMPLDFAAVQPEMRPDGAMRYKWASGSGAVTLADDDVFRLPWKVQADGRSLSPVTIHRESIALSLAARKYQLNLMSNGASPKGGIKVPTDISDEAAEKILSSWERRHKGPENAGRMAVFDGGLEWMSIGMSNEDAQFVELMNMSTRDVARIFRVQPHKIGDLEKATFSNIEHQSIEFVTDTLLPWVRRIEARMEQWLLTAADRQVFSVEFNMRGLLRGDAKARAELYSALFYTGAISANEIRRMEGMNPIPDGDRYYVQSASAPTDIIDRVLLGDTPAADGQD